MNLPTSAPVYFAFGVWTGLGEIILARRRNAQ